MLCPEDWRGAKKWVFNVCPWNPEHRNKSAFLIQHANGALAAGCHHNGCKGKNWHDLRNLLEPGLRGAGAVDNNRPGAVWEAPASFHHVNVPQFPIDALPGWVRAFVEAEATATQTPIDLTAMLVLSVISMCCAKKIAICVQEGYIEPLNLYTVTALPPGNRKSSVFPAAIQPLETFECLEAQRTSIEIAQQQMALEIKEAALKKLKDQAAQAKAEDERRRYTREAQDLAAEVAGMHVAHPTRYLADDCTPERLSTLLSHHAGRIAVMSPEGDVFSLMAGRYSTKGMPNFGVFLKGHSGDTLRVDRVGRSEFVKSPAITMGLAVQPEVIRGLAANPEFRGRGLLGRFLYSIPASLLGRRNPDAPPVPADVREQYRANITALLQLPSNDDGSGNAEPQLLRLPPEARALIREFEIWLEPQLGEFGPLGNIVIGLENSPAPCAGLPASFMWPVWRMLIGLGPSLSFRSPLSGLFASVDI